MATPNGSGRRKSDGARGENAEPRVHVLAVDDDRTYLAYLNLVLTRAGFEVTIARDGDAAIDRVQRDSSIGLLLVDLQMPMMDGIETLQKLRTRTDSERLYTILLTAQDNSETKLRALNSGFDDFLSKVAPESEILAKLRSAARRLNLERRLHVENAQLQALALTDELTGVANRRGLFQSGEELAANGRECSVDLFDLDHFKQINDTYGHLAGDHILTEVAACLKKHTRTGDVIARYGGDEFVLLLPDTAEAEARVIAERIARQIRALEPFFDRSVKISASLGVSTGTNVRELFRKCDAECYERKAALNETMRRQPNGGPAVLPPLVR
jgi:two-component system cell cycle response regulator